MALLLFASVARAADDDAARLALAREVVLTSHAADNLRKLMPLMANQMRGILARQGQVDASAVDAFVQRFQTRMAAETDGFVDLAAQIYAKEFTAEDLRDLVAFYRTPTGQHLIEKQTVITQAMIAAGQNWGRTIAQEVLADMQKERQNAPAPKL